MPLFKLMALVDSPKGLETIAPVALTTLSAPIDILTQVSKRGTVLAPLKVHPPFWVLLPKTSLPVPEMFPLKDESLLGDTVT